MKRGNFKRHMVTVLAGIVAAISGAHALAAPAGDVVARVERVTPGGQRFTVIDRQGTRIEAVRPVRPPQATALEVDGSLANAGALREGDTVQLTGVNHGDWFEVDRVQVLTGTRVGAATTTPVLRFQGKAFARELRAVSADGVEYRIAFPPRPQVIRVWQAGSLAELSALHEGDRILAHGIVSDHLIRADRVEVLDESRVGAGAEVPLRLTYRGSPSWRRLIGEAADGARYPVTLPRRPQAVYFVRDGALVEPSALKPGDTIEVRGVLRGDEIAASQITVR